VNTYTIGEIAARTGFSASALRYYEGVGLLTPASRTDAGYRVYDDETLSRLAFIGRAKRLGCSLDEITDLAGMWDGDRCGPVQRQFHELVTAKIADAQGQIAELIALTSQLQAAAAQLNGRPIDGPCGDDCACVADESASTSFASEVLVNLSVKSDHAPIACTLEPGAMPDRLADWQAILDRVRVRTTAADGAVRVEFDHDISLGELTTLVAAEQHCCAFLSFAITVDQRGVGLEVRAPVGAAEIVAALFGQCA